HSSLPIIAFSILPCCRLSGTSHRVPKRDRRQTVCASPIRHLKFGSSVRTFHGGNRSRSPIRGSPLLAASASRAVGCDGGEGGLGSPGLAARRRGVRTCLRGGRDRRTGYWKRSRNVRRGRLSAEREELGGSIGGLRTSR